MANFHVHPLRQLVASLILFILSFSLSSAEEVDNIIELRGLTPGSADEVTVAGYYKPGDGGGGTFVWNSSNTQADNHGTIIRPAAGGTGRWERVYDNHINILWFGARGDDKPYADNHTRIQAALDYVAASSVKRVYMPQGIYQVSGSILLNQHHNDIEFFGELNYTTVSREEMLAMMPDRLSWLDLIYSWSENDPKYQEFRVVDESNSSIIKRVQDVDQWIGNTNLLVLFNDSNLSGVVSHITFKDLAFDGNRQPGDTEDIFMNNIVFSTIGGANAENLIIDNVVSYGATRNAFYLRLKGITANNLLTYNNGLHGIGAAGTQVVVNGKNWEAHNCGILQTSGGTHGADLHGTSIVNDVFVHHNREGVKTATQSVYLDLNNLVTEYNFHHGFQQTVWEHTPEAGTYFRIRRIETRNNGAAGIRFLFGEERILDYIEAENNGLKDTGGFNWPNIHATDVKFGTVISKNYNGHGDHSIYFFGEETEVQYLEVRDNNKPGVNVYNGHTTIHSGKIYNNNKAGIYIGDHSDGSSTVTLYNIKFGSPDESNPYRQTYRDIYCNGKGMLIHRELDFSDSKVSPGNWIRVNTIMKADE